MHKTASHPMGVALDVATIVVCFTFNQNEDAVPCFFDISSMT